MLIVFCACLIHLLMPPTHGFILRQVGMQIYLTRLEQRQVVLLEVTKELVVLDLKPAQLEKQHLTGAILSPKGRWLAFGTGYQEHSTDERCLTIVDMHTLAVAYQKKEAMFGEGRWYVWEGENRLRFRRDVDFKPDEPVAFDVFHISGPNWNAPEKYGGRKVGNGLTLYSPSTEAERRVSKAAERMKQLGYAPPLAPEQSGNLSWKDYLWGRSGGVSKDGKAIAAIVYTRPGYKLVLVQEATHWQEQVIPEPRIVHTVQFWNGWLVLGLGDRSKADTFRFVSVEDTKGSQEWKGDFFLPTPPQEH